MILYNRIQTVYFQNFYNFNLRMIQEYKQCNSPIISCYRIKDIPLKVLIKVYLCREKIIKVKIF